MTVVFAVCAMAALAGLYWSARAAITIAVFDVEDGVIRRRRGRLPAGVLADVADVLAKPPVTRGRVRILRDAGRARVEVRGAIGPEHAQRLRNVIGNVPLARLARGASR